MAPFHAEYRKTIYICDGKWNLSLIAVAV